MTDRIVLYCIVLYIINLIFPCLLIYAVSFLGFFLPVCKRDIINYLYKILDCYCNAMIMIMSICDTGTIYSGTDQSNKYRMKTSA